MTLPASSVVGPRHTARKRGSWLIIQRKWTKKRARERVVHSPSDQKSAAKARWREGEGCTERKERKIRLINTWSVTRWCRVHTSKRRCKGRPISRQPASTLAALDAGGVKEEGREAKGTGWPRQRRPDCLSLCLISHSRR